MYHRPSTIAPGVDGSVGKASKDDTYGPGILVVGDSRRPDQKLSGSEGCPASAGRVVSVGADPLLASVIVMAGVTVVEERGQEPSPAFSFLTEPEA